MRRRRRLGHPAEAVVFAVLAVASASAEESLPSAPGRALLLQACVQCHDLRPVTAQRKAEAAWRRTVNEMIWRGAPLLPGEADVLTRYLAGSFGPDVASRPVIGTDVRRPERAGEGPDPPSSDPDAQSLPPGPARALVLRACVGCHDLRTTVSRRKTAQEWHDSVDLMVRLGARLQASEITDVAEYLSSFLASTDARREGERRR